MIQSMTGFGSANINYEGKQINIEIKTLNSKSIELQTKLHTTYKEKEFEIRNLIIDKLHRGKIDFSITIQNNNNKGIKQINTEEVINYYKELKKISETLNISINQSDLFCSIITKPDLLKEDEDNSLNSNEWQLVSNAIHKAVDECNNYRVIEGQILEKEIISNVNSILSNLARINTADNQRIENIKSKLDNSLSKIKNNIEIDKWRFEQELLYYAERIDINEEKIRLKKHCDYFIEIIKKETICGKILAFTTQEMNREINTIGSKANDYDIQKIVILMKDDIEKIKEQINNIL